MANAGHSTEFGTGRGSPAWAISVAVHLSAVVLLGLVVARTPPPPPGDPDGSTSMEVCCVSEEISSQRTADEQETAVLEPPPRVPELAPELLSVTPVEYTKPAEEIEPAPAATPAASRDESQRAPANPDPGNRASTPSDGKARVNVFGVEGTGTKFVYLFDRSSSMEGSPLAAAKKQLIESLKGLDTVHQFQIIFFNQDQQIVDLSGGGRRIAFATERNKQLAAKFIGGRTADGGTDRLAALKRALALRPNVIFFLTDVDDPMPARELAEIDRLNGRIGATISTIEFGRGAAPAGDNFLKEIARGSGGQYGYVDVTKLPR